MQRAFLDGKSAGENWRCSLTRIFTVRPQVKTIPRQPQLACGSFMFIIVKRAAHVKDRSRTHSVTC